ncbi:MAG: ankyrin repeat domain-containing protein [Alphaproteobacteria bacterium]|nr:ankyrin repeat domain-containing protein [Alphaproteobacteria bacterium]
MPGSKKESLLLYELSKIETCDQSTCLQLIKDGADLNATDDLGWTPLISAICNNDMPVFQALIENGADINQTSDCNESPLFFCLSMGRSRTEMAQTLIAKGADVNAANDEGRTILMEAAGEGLSALAQTILERGAKIGAKNDDGLTAEMIAKFNHNENVVLCIQREKLRRKFIKAARKGTRKNRKILRKPSGL